MVKRDALWVVPLSLATVLASACPKGSAPNGVRQRTHGDTTFVTSPEIGVDGPVRLVELRRGADSIEFNRVDAGAFGPGGTLWVLDLAGDRGATLHVFDSLGRRQAVAGRDGAGPGEYRPPARVFRLANGTILLKEMSTPRALLFDAAGRVLATLTLPVAVSNGWVVTPDLNGGWYIAASFEEITPKKVGRYGWLHFGPDGSVVDTVFPPAAFFDEPTPLGIAPGRIRTVGRDGAILTTVPGPNRLTQLGPGRAVRVLEWAGAPPPYGPDERSDMQQVADRLSDMVGAPRALLPEGKQPVNRILTDATGLIWVQLSTPGIRVPTDALPAEPGPLTVRWYEPDRWGAFGGDGALRFAVDLPAGTFLLDREGDRLLGVVSDSTGAQTIVVWRIERGLPPPAPGK